MPNWCDNRITITGPNKLIDKIEKIVKEDGDEAFADSSEPKGLLQLMNPMPKELRDTTSPTPKGSKQPVIDGDDNWYDWAVHNWGTKWELCEFFGVDRQHLNDSLDESTISFSTQSAWAPPLNALDHFISENPEVGIHCTYYEPGCDFMGIWDNGDDQCWTISDTAPKSDDPWWTTPEGITIDGAHGIVETMENYEAEEETEAERKVRELVVEKKAVNIGEDQ